MTLVLSPHLVPDAEGVGVAVMIEFDPHRAMGHLEMSG